MKRWIRSEIAMTWSLPGIAGPQENAERCASQPGEGRIPPEVKIGATNAQPSFDSGADSVDVDGVGGAVTRKGPQELQLRQEVAILNLIGREQVIGAQRLESEEV